MARKPMVGREELYEIATYLARPETRTEIHAEIPYDHRARFEQEYHDATEGYPLPQNGGREPYYVWPMGTDKRGRELRIYFMRMPPEPPPIERLYTDNDQWRDGFRINHSNLVMQLFECGFVLGMNNENGDRIEEFMRMRFPVPEHD